MGKILVWEQAIEHYLHGWPRSERAFRGVAEDNQRECEVGVRSLGQGGLPLAGHEAWDVSRALLS